jgi:integrase
VSALTELEIRNAKAREKPYKLYDERGLYLIVRPDGARWWRYRYAVAGREKLLSLGTYPDVSLRRAREKRDDMRRQVADGVDPAVRRRADKIAAADTFGAVAEEWLRVKKSALTESTWQRERHELTVLAAPLSGRPIAQIEAPELLAVLRRLEARGVVDTAHRVRAAVGRVMRFAIATGRAKHDVSHDLRGALTPRKPESYAAITEPARIGELLRSIDQYRGQPQTIAALKLAPYVFCRPGEVRWAEWSEFSLDGETPEWRIPDHRMKMREEHVVPLARQAVAILRDLQPITGHGRYVFPALHTSLRPISENTINQALRRMGYGGDEMTAHGFRAMASTRLNEMGYPTDPVELQLAHKERNKVRAAYNRALRLGERRKMMQEWADYLDELKAGRSK